MQDHETISIGEELSLSLSVHQHNSERDRVYVQLVRLL